jgi:hypothetical protein
MSSDGHGGRVGEARVSGRAGAGVAVLAAVVFLVVVPGGVGVAGGSEPASINGMEACVSASMTTLALVERELAPAANATVQAGVPVTFTVGRSEVPLTFLVASTPVVLPSPDAYHPDSPTLGSPDVDSGAGTVLPSGLGPSGYTFTSQKAGVIPRDLYWEVSFSTSGLPACATQIPSQRSTPPRMLTVLPAPVPVPSPVPPPARVSIDIPGRLSLSSRVSYRVQCSEACTGDTFYHAYLLRGHARPVRFPLLDLAPQRVSIAGEWGGAERFICRYDRRQLRLLKSAVRAGSGIELRLGVKVRDLAGNTVRAQASILLHA